MPVNTTLYQHIIKELTTKKVTLVAVSKTKTAGEILELYQLGQRDFGENYVQELTEKYEQLPKDIRWHFIGDLQSNKIKFIAPFVTLIQSVDSEKLLAEIDKQAKKNNRPINCLLQVHIAAEETKFGFSETELAALSEAHLQTYNNVRVVGLMGMASFTENIATVTHEFKKLKSLFDHFGGQHFSILSMGMSADYKIAIETGSTMVRVGSLLFGERHPS